MLLIVRRFFTLLGFVLSAVPALAQAQALQEITIWSCRDKDGRTHVTNLREDTRGKDCRVVQQTRVQVMPAPAQSSNSRAPSSAHTRQREILERELEQEQTLLAQARKELEDQESVRYGDERNYAKVLERLQKYKDAVELHNKNVESLRRELTNLYR
jgi:hypothetical protein